jgi:6-phosphogluconolactonase
LNLERCPDAETAARRAAELIAAAGNEAVAERGSFSMALSGGTTALPMFAALAEAELPWEAATVFQVDERVAPAGDSERNLTHMVVAFPPAVQERLRPMPVGEDDLDAAAARYATELPDLLDLVHLGIGPDGHFASLVPGDEVLDVTDRDVAMTATEYQGRRRMTLTYPRLRRARQVIWLVAGADKREPLRKLMAGDESIPAGRLHADDSLVIADAAACG